LLDFGGQLRLNDHHEVQRETLKSGWNLVEAATRRPAAAGQYRRRDCRPGDGCGRYLPGRMLPLGSAEVAGDCQSPDLVVAGQLLHVAELVERVRLAGTVSKVALLLECLLVARRGRVVAG